MSYFWLAILLMAALIAAPTVTSRLLSSKRIGASAWDEGTALQIRMSVHVGDVNSPDPAMLYVETKGRMEHAPELLLWLAVRTVTDVDGLHKRSSHVGGLGVPDYLRLLGARAEGRQDTSQTAHLWRTMLRALALSGGRPKTVDCALVINLVDGGASGLKWLGMVHLQGPVGDMVHIAAPWLLWDHLDATLSETERTVAGKFMKALAGHPAGGRFGDLQEASAWVDRVVREVRGSAHEPFLPFKQPCPKCGGEPSPVGIASSAFLLGIAPEEFKVRYGPRCTNHLAEVVRPRNEEELASAYKKAMVFVAAAVERRRDEVILFRKGDSRGLTETHYSSGRVVHHDPPLKEDDE